MRIYGGDIDCATVVERMVGAAGMETSGTLFYDYPDPAEACVGESLEGGFPQIHRGHREPDKELPRDAEGAERIWVER